MLANILVVEDDGLQRNFICQVLRGEGHETIEASDGAEALELLHHEHFDLAIIDFIIPKINSLKLVEQLHVLQRQIPIIFITGYLSINSGQTILGDMAEFLPKPFELDVLRSTTKRLLESTSH
jgi:CheY-like chemotaxis protein